MDQSDLMYVRDVLNQVVLGPFDLEDAINALAMVENDIVHVEEETVESESTGEVTAMAADAEWSVGNNDNSDENS